MALSLMPEVIDSQYELDSKEVTEDACPWRGLISRNLMCSSDCKDNTVKVWNASRGFQGHILGRPQPRCHLRGITEVTEGCESTENLQLCAQR